MSSRCSVLLQRLQHCATFSDLSRMVRRAPSGCTAGIHSSPFHSTILLCISRIESGAERPHRYASGRYAKVSRSDRQLLHRPRPSTSATAPSHARLHQITAGSGRPSYSSKSHRTVPLLGRQQLLLPPTGSWVLASRRICQQVGREGLLFSINLIPWWDSKARLSMKSFFIT